MSEIKIIVVSGKKIIENEVLEISTTLSDSKYFLLEGIVYQNDMKPIPNAAIKIFKIDNNTVPPARILIGITFSTENGLYGISLLEGEEYMLIVYS